MKNRIENVVSILTGIIFLPVLYINATTNALHNSYYPGIESFLLPFNNLYLLFLLLFLALLILSIFYRVKNKRGSAFCRKVAISIIVSCVIVLFLNYLPCLYYHKDPHTLESVVLQSTLCPSYSIRSYVGILEICIIAVATLLISVGKIYPKP
jgi:hypothetical protein